MSLRKDWVNAKARAAKENGGKDVWKDFTLKDLGFGPVLDAFEAAEARFDAFDAKLDEATASRQQKDQWLKLLMAKERSAKKAEEIAGNYKIDIDRLKARGLINDKAWNALSNGLTHAKHAITPNPQDVAQLRKKVARLGS